ncbi:MAG TPA: bifunctional methylenetetrahydrofolate dehydrogenase/methenyltetrahydrofolate cyclohydrolase FolD [Thermoanaerobaculia bacterium]|nr:bifunctional methylenetetrahydrofolate dehydrogenase/methenyltetrahydrofolate cyclohydrolase FolD [Thermoanaerobaculia bacterium]
MTAQSIDGREVAAQVERDVREELDRLRARGIEPGLAVIRVGEDPASHVYVRSKARKAEDLGIHGIERHLPADVSERELIAEIERLNADPAIDGILLQLPLPPHLNPDRLLDRIDPRKDVDGFHPTNVGLLHQGRPRFVPCTPAGVMRLIDSTGEAIEGRRAVVIGRSNIVGKPMAALLLQQHATVTLCHSRTRDLAAVAAEAEILIAAIGRPLLVTGEMIRPGAIVIDVGMNQITTTDPAARRLPPKRRELLDQKGSVLCGDVDFAAASEAASWVTPVPGGVGPMTIAMLMQNTVQAARERRS